MNYIRTELIMGFIAIAVFLIVIIYLLTNKNK